MIGKVGPLVSLMVPKEEIENIQNGLTVINDKIKDTTFIEVPYKEGILSLEVKTTEDNISTIDIPIKSERILEKLREMRE